MALTLLTLAELRDYGLAIIRGLITDADTSEGSDYWVTASMCAALANGNQSQAEYLIRQAFPSSAESTYLLVHARERGIVAAPAAKAIGRVLLVEKDAGTAAAAGAVQANGSVYTHADGRTYVQSGGVTMLNPAWTGKTTGPGCGRQRLFIHPDVSGMAAGDPFKISGVRGVIKEVLSSIQAIDISLPLAAAPASGVAIAKWVGAIVSVEAAETGEAGNKLPGDVVVLGSPIHVDLDPNCAVLEMSGGGSDESEESIRRRIIDAMSVPAGSGNAAHYRAWARETEDVRLDDAFIYPQSRDLGTVDIIPFGVSGSRLVGNAVLLKVQQHIATEAPFHHDALVLAFTYESGSTDVSITVNAASGHEKDWVGTRTVDAASTTTQINLTTSPVGVIEVGDRVIVYVDLLGRRRPYVRTVEAVTSTYILLDEALPALPVSGEIVRPGASSTQGIIDAIEKTFDELGPGDTVPATRHPSPSLLWNSTLRVSRLTAAIQAVGGVDGLAMTAPSADVTPAAKEVVKLGQIVIQYS